ncbi:MAG: LysM peptidoglycan-binding domain-containing protein [Anaerolineae bacterium]|nr:LysM peptidoglycan-binding domain-containing protein [Anaerolineae bacterium]
MKPSTAGRCFRVLSVVVAIAVFLSVLVPTVRNKLLADVIKNVEAGEEVTNFPLLPHLLYLPSILTPPYVIETTIPLTGGSLIAPEYGFILTVPANYYSEPLRFVYVARPAPVINGTYIWHSAFDLHAYAADGIEITQFDELLTLAQTYDETIPNNINPDDLYLAYQGEDGNWVALPSVVDVDGQKVTAVTDHFTPFALMAPADSVPYEVGIRDPVVGPEYFTDAFRAAYHRNGGESEIGLPFGFVHRYFEDGGDDDSTNPWIQDFNWASIIYNPDTGTAYYIQGEYISKYVNSGGPGGFLGLPVSDRFTPPDSAILMDKHTDFMENEVQQFEYGFIGEDSNESNGSGFMAVRYYPIFSGADISVEWYDPDPGNGIPEVKARVTLTTRDVFGHPSYNDKREAGPADIWIEADDNYFDGWVPGQGSEPKIWENLDPVGEFSFRLEAWVNGAGGYQAGYLACDSYKKEQAEEPPSSYLFGPIPLSVNGYSNSWSYDCTGFGGGGGYNDTISPTITHSPADDVWQNGHGWAQIDAHVSDNVRVAYTTLYVNGQAYPMTLWAGNVISGTYARVVPLRLGQNEYYFEAYDTSGNRARLPENEGEFFHVYATQDADFGFRPDMGYSDDPVNTGLGNFVFNYVDVEIPALGPGIVIERWFNHQSRYNGLFGIGWTFAYDMRLQLVDNLLLSGAQLRYGDGHTVNFARNGTGEFVSDDTPHDILREIGGEYVLITKQDINYHFNANGRLTRISDDDGNSIIFAYSGEVLSSLTDASGRVLTFTYEDGRIMAIDVPDYGTLTYEYIDGRLIAATDTEGNVSQYSYDDEGCILSITSPNGNPFLNSQTCDEDGRVTYQLGGTGYVNQFSYDDDVTTITDPYGNVTTHVYDEEFHLIENRDALGNSIFYTYSEDHLPLSITDKNGNTTTYTYDERGNLLTVTDPHGNVTIYTYDADDNVLTRTDALGNLFTYEYDAEGHLVRSIAPDGGVVEHNYNDEGLLIRTVDELGNATETTYNAQGLPVAVTDALGNTATMTYDAAGHILSLTDASGHTSTYQYNSRDLVTVVTDPEGYTTIYEYDSDRNLIGETNQDGYVKTYTYDENGRLVAETDWAGNVTTYEYDDLGRKTKETDPLGYSIVYVYDEVSNLVAKTDKRGATTTYTYDANGNRLSETDALVNTTFYVYDELNQLVEVHYPCDCPSRVEYTTYDPLGRISSRTDANGNVTMFEYDALGWETKRVDALGYETIKIYDLGGNLITEIDALGHETQYEYDALNRVVTTTNRLGYTVINTYDETGRLIARTDQRGNTTHYVYDGNNRLVEMIDPLGGVTSYSYDGRGNRLAMTDARGHTSYFVYDANSNLISETNPRGYTTTYSYDARNQRLTTVDALGGITSYTYDPAGALLTETDALGYTRTTTYDILGRTETEMDRNGNVTTYVYDAAGNISQVIDALGGITSYTYDPNNNRLTETNALGHATTYLYDALNRQITVIDALSGVSTRDYDALGRLIEMVDANGQATTYLYDAEGQRIATTDALGHTSTTEYDPAGNVIREVDRNGNITLYEYDALNRQTAVTNGLGHTAFTVYDEAGNVVARTNFRGYTTTFEYDENNNLIRQTDALGGVTTYEYDALDRQISMSDANGHTTSRSYNAVGSLTAVTLPEGQVSSYSYDGERNRISFTNGRGFTTQYEYDALNRQVRMIDPLGHVTSTVYDAIGQVVGDVDANGNGNVYTYDALGRLIGVTDALGYTTIYIYDAVGNRLGKLDANGHLSVFSYDALNRLILEANAEGDTWLFSYDSEGNLIERLDANGQLTHYVFDAVHQLVAIQYPDPAQNVSYGYDENGNLVQIVDPVGTTSLVYDPLDREVSKTDGYGRLTHNGYDAVGNRISLTYPDGNVMTYIYNANDWLVSVVEPQNGQTSYSYEDDGQVRTIDKANNTWESNVYDAAGRLTRLFNGTHHGGGGVVTAYDYTLDAVGNRLQIIEQYTQGQVRTNVKTYTYNNRYELLEAVELYAGPPAYTVTTSYTYDAVGNRLSMTTDRDTGPGPQPDPVTITYSYDQANRMLTAGDVTFTYDNNGNRLSKLTPGTPPAQSRLETYTYDAENRMTLYVRQRVNNGQIEQRVYNVFDGLGRRVNKGLQDANGTIKWTHYALDGLSYDQLAEFPMTGPPRVNELYRGWGNSLLSMNEIQGNGAGTQYWFASDGSQNVAATTKQDGQSAHEYFYDPYGQLIDANGHWEDSSSWTNPHNHYLLTGKEWDEESRLYYFGARFYDADAGVWLTADPYRGEIDVPRTLHPYLHLGHNPPGQADNTNSPMSTHSYLYGQNNPLNRIDPLGFFNWNTGHVEPGDTLSQIAQDAGVSIAQIRSWNPQIEHPDKIIAGMYIWLPANAVQAGKMAEAIRMGAGTNESVWGKNPPACDTGLAGRKVANCPTLPTIDIGVQFNLSTAQFQAVGLAGFFELNLETKGSIIKGFAGIGIKWDPVDVNPLLKKADNALQKLLGLHIVLEAQIGGGGEFEYNLCTQSGDIRLCGFGRVSAGIESRMSGVRSNGQYTRERFGATANGEAKLCVSLCNGHLTWSAYAKWSVYANFGNKWFNRDYQYSGEIGSNELNYITTLEKFAVLRKYCG